MYTIVFMADFIHNNPNLKIIQKFSTKIDKEIYIYTMEYYLTIKKRMNF